MSQGRLYVYRADDADFFIARNGAKFGVYRLHEYFNNIYERRVIGKRIYTVYYDNNKRSIKGEKKNIFESELNKTALDGEWIVWSDKY